MKMYIYSKYIFFYFEKLFFLNIKKNVKFKHLLICILYSIEKNRFHRDINYVYV